MDARTTSLEEFLSAVLRGAAKILGCGSTNLILINEKTQEIRIRLGTMAASYPMVKELEGVLGRSLNGVAVSMKNAQDSLVYRAWRERALLETSSLIELVGSAFPRPVLSQMAGLIGEHRFVCVPALSTARSYGVLLFQKEGRQPFSRQQRQLLLRYARRIGEILESDLTGQGQQLVSRLPGGGPEYLLVDPSGRLLGRAAGSGKAPLDEERLEQVRARVRALGEAGAAPEPRSRATVGELAVELVPFELQGQPCLLCAVPGRHERSDLSLENQLLQLTLGEAAPAIFVDPELLITSCNEPTEPLLGYSPAELLHRPIASLFCEPQQILDILQQQLLDPTIPHVRERCLLRRKDGSLALVAVEALLLADDQNQAVGLLVLARPVAAEENAADRLVRQERLATMGEMAAQLAHEMRNPLVAIGATLESLRADPALSEAHRQVLGSVADEIVRMDMTLKDYLAARHDLSFAEVDLREVVEGARRLLESASRRGGQSILDQVPAGLLVRADHDALKHVIFNLLLNALEASPPKGEVRCQAVVGPQHVSLAVIDSGPGLAASPDECFQPFFTTKKNGTGLGLTVCQKIVRAHGGVVELCAEPGGGCRATVTLPVVASPGGAA